MKVVTVNIAAFSAAAKKEALRAFLVANKVDVVLLQEVAIPEFNFPGYDEVENVGEQRRGTAILARDRLGMTSPLLLPSGRGTSVMIGDVTIVNVYAPAGTRFKAERAKFFAEEVTPLMAAAGERLVLGGDFNCVLRAADTTGVYSACPQLAALARNSQLLDVWPTLRADRGHTYVTAAMSSRLDRLYCSSSMQSLLQSADTLPAAFSDHLAVVCQLRWDDVTPPSPSRPAGSWVLDAGILDEEEFKDMFKDQWVQWCAQHHRFASPVEWWLRLAEPSIRQLAADYTRERRRQQGEMLDFLQATLQELYRKPQRSAADIKCLREVKQSILQLHADRLRGTATRAKLDSTVDNEPVSMHHVFHARRRSKQQHITRLETADGKVLDLQDDISAHLLSVYSEKFSLPAGPACPASALLDLEETFTEQDNSILTQDITLEEVKAAVMSSAKRKSPGEDGLVAELYMVMWPVIGEVLLEVLTDLWQRDSIPEEMLRGTIVFIPKKRGANSVKDFRPLTMINCDAKIFARLLATRLTRPLDKLLHPSQVRPGGVQGCSRRCVTCAMLSATWSTAGSKPAS